MRGGSCWTGASDLISGGTFSGADSLAGAFALLTRGLAERVRTRVGFLAESADVCSSLLGGFSIT